MTNRTLYLVTGKPGVGKTTFGLELADRHKAVFLDIDTMTEPVVMAGLSLAKLDPLDRDSPVFKEVYRDAIYQALFAVARQNLMNHSVVITGPFSKELKDPDWTKKLQDQFSSDVTVFYLHCPEALRYRRLKQRANPRDIAKLKDWSSHQGYYQNDKPACIHIDVDTETA